MNKITDKIYHGCATRYANGERKLIDFEKCDMCLVPMSDPFWKEPTDIYRMQTRNSTKKRQLLVGPFKVNKINLQKYNFSLTRQIKTKQYNQLYVLFTKENKT